MGAAESREHERSRPRTQCQGAGVPGADRGGGGDGTQVVKVQPHRGAAIGQLAEALRGPGTRMRMAENRGDCLWRGSLDCRQQRVVPMQRGRGIGYGLAAEAHYSADQKLVLAELTGAQGG